MSALPLPSFEPSVPSSLPDVAAHHPGLAPGRIDRVGMEHIELPVRIRGDREQLLTVPADADVFVSLDREDAKGIHMSRLFLALQDVLGEEELTPATLRLLLDTFLQSHHDLSASSHVRIRCNYLIEREALESGHRGWKSYPLEISATLRDGELRTELGLEVAYSSTCPCSAALSREIIAGDFARQFEGRDATLAEMTAWLRSEKGLPATPHSQRSYTEVRVLLDESAPELPVIDLIDAVEDGLGTPVQAAVKREDEQAFAVLNGRNLMFCEDAARIVKRTLDADERVADFHVKVRHEESLHPHDAVAVITKGVPGGFVAGEGDR